MMEEKVFTFQKLKTGKEPELIVLKESELDKGGVYEDLLLGELERKWQMSPKAVQDRFTDIRVNEAVKRLKSQIKERKKLDN